MSLLLLFNQPAGGGSTSTTEVSPVTFNADYRATFDDDHRISFNADYRVTLKDK